MEMIPKKGKPDNERTEFEEPGDSIHLNQDDRNITDGGEFLDDALRMKEQPFGETKMDKEE